MSKPRESKGWAGLCSFLILVGFPLTIACMIILVVIGIGGGYIAWGDGFFAKGSVSPSILDSPGFRWTFRIWLIASLAFAVGVHLNRWDQGRGILSGTPKSAQPEPPSTLRRGLVSLVVVVGLVIVGLKLSTLFFAQFRGEPIEQALARGWSEPPPTKLQEFFAVTVRQWEAQQREHRKVGQRIPDPNFDDLKAILSHAVRSAKSAWGAQDETLAELDKIYLANGSRVLYAGALLQYLVDKAPSGWVENEIRLAVAAVQANPPTRSSSISTRTTP